MTSWGGPAVAPVSSPNPLLDHALAWGCGGSPLEDVNMGGRQHNPTRT